MKRKVTATAKAAPRRARTEESKRDVRQGILDAASKEFLEHGYENFSLRRVAERAGYSATTIYIYFQNKDDLLLETVKDGFAHFDQAIARAADMRLTPLERIRALGRTYIRFGLDNPGLYRVMFMQRSDFYVMPRLTGRGTPPDEMPDPDDEKQQPVVAQHLLVSAVEAAIKAKQIPKQNPLLVADALWAAAHGIVALAASPLMSREHAEPVAERLFDVLIQGLQKPK